MKITFSPRKTVIILSIIVAVLTLLSLAGQFYKYLVLDGNDRYLVKMFFLDDEFNFPTLYSTLSLLICSVLTGTIYSLKKSGNESFKTHWLGLSVIFFLLATDEILRLHEQIITPLRNMLGTGGFLYMAWIIPAVLFGIVFLVSYYKFLIDLPKQSRNRFIISGLIFVVGAVGFEAIGGKFFSEYGKDNLFYSLITHVEELFEMIGIVLFIYALLLYLKSFYSTFSISISND
jgi:hypothetical protein